MCFLQGVLIAFCEFFKFADWTNYIFSFSSNVHVNSNRTLQLKHCIKVFLVLCRSEVIKLQNVYE